MGLCDFMCLRSHDVSARLCGVVLDLIPAGPRGLTVSDCDFCSKRWARSCIDRDFSCLSVHLHSSKGIHLIDCILHFDFCKSFRFFPMFFSRVAVGEFGKDLNLILLWSLSLCFWVFASNGIFLFSFSFLLFSFSHFLFGLSLLLSRYPEDCAGARRDHFRLLRANKLYYKAGQLSWWSAW